MFSPKNDFFGKKIYYMTEQSFLRNKNIVWLTKSFLPKQDFGLKLTKYFVRSEESAK